jgi:hypothetical protein
MSLSFQGNIMHTIKIDDEVYTLLQANAKPFVDTENSTLRRMLGLDRPRNEATPAIPNSPRKTGVMPDTGRDDMERDAVGNAGVAPVKLGGKTSDADTTIDDLISELNAMPRAITRTKAPKAELPTLVRSGQLKEGETLYLVDYQNTPVNDHQAVVNGKDLRFEGRTFSMSSLARELLQKAGYTSDSVRGPSHWATAKGTTITELWEDFLSKQRKN